jgi:hypothetical protein
MGTIDALFSCRLKSARRRKRLQKKDKEKRLIQLHKEERKLNKQIWNLGYEPLIPPVQRGWKRTFVLREDVKRGEKSGFFLELLKKINTVQYSDRKDFTKKGRVLGRKIRNPREQRLRHLHLYELPKAKLTEEEALFFKESFVFHRNKVLEKVLEFTEPWRFVLKVMPNMITEVKIKDGVLEQKREEINNYLQRNNLYPKLFRLIDGHYQCNGRDKNNEKPKYKNLFKNKPFHIILNDFDD